MSRHVTLTLMLTGVMCTLTLEPGLDARQRTRTFSDPAAYVPDLRDLQAATSELRDTVMRVSADAQAIQRFYNVAGSTARRERLRGFYRAWLASLPTIEFDRLSQQGRVDYVLLRTHAEYNLALLDREERAQAQTARYVPFASAIERLQEDRQRLAFITPGAALSAIQGIAGQVEDAQAAASAGPPPATPTVAVKAAQRVEVLRGALAQWYGFFNGYDPAFSKNVPPAYDALNAALTEYARMLREQLGGVPPGTAAAGDESGRGGGRGGPGNAGGGPAAERTNQGPIIGDPIGREGLLEDLRGEMIPYTPEALIEIGRREYDWAEAEMKKASREMGFGDDWRKALEKVKSIHVPMGEQPALARELALEAIEYLRKHDLVTVPPLIEDAWRMNMMAPAQMRVAPFFLGGETILVSYPTGAMSEAEQATIMRANGPHFSRAIVHHELIPGHGLQGFMAARYNAHRSLFDTPFLSEGWALHWELVLWDLGFPRGPEDRIGMLFWRMHRAARIVFSLNFHLGRWTPQQCIDFLVDGVGHERFTAEGEVRRSFAGTYSPLYQIAYMMGALQIRSLYQELVGSKKMTPRAFHDALLKQGEMPIEMLRAALTNQRLTRSYSASWKYYGDVEPGQR